MNIHPPLFIDSRMQRGCLCELWAIILLKYRNTTQFIFNFSCSSVKSEQKVNKYTNVVDKRFIKRYNANHVAILNFGGH